MRQPMLMSVSHSTASPYLPQQWNYNDPQPTQAYDQFSAEVGCVDDQGPSNSNHSVLECLRFADTIVLQNASAKVSAGYKYGQWAFLPVTDKGFLPERPAVQLKAGKVNGLRMLTSVSIYLPALFADQLWRNVSRHTDEVCTE